MPPWDVAEQQLHAHYLAVLEIQHPADSNRAYKRLKASAHPDKISGSEARFLAIQQARDIAGGVRGSADFHMTKGRRGRRKLAGTSRGETARGVRTAGSPMQELPRGRNRTRGTVQPGHRSRMHRHPHQVQQRYERQRWSPHTPHTNERNQSGALR